ncbi:hypothetical protein PMAYCL1PPCAC_26154, partial [Pristionchus mayeri]
MSISAVFILDFKGKPIISRDYRGDIDMDVIEQFVSLVEAREEDGTQSPVITHEGVTYVFIKRLNVYVVAISRRNMNIALVLSYLYKAVEVFGEYFEEVEEESVRDNFVCLYELFDEMMDFGHPQTTECKILQE